MERKDIIENEIEVLDLLDESEINQLLTETNMILVSDSMPLSADSVKIVDIETAHSLGYVDPDFNNCEIGVFYPKGKFIYKGIRYELVPFMIHSSIDEKHLTDSQN